MTVLARKIGKQMIPIVEKFTELESIVRHARSCTSGRSIGVRVKLATRRGRPLEVERRLPLQVRPDPVRGPGRRRVSQAARHGRLPAARAFPHRQPDHQHPQHQGGPDRGGARFTSRCTASGPASSTSTSAAAWASTTTARNPTSCRRSTTRLQEYANDVVFRIKNVCDEAEVPHPTIFSESGRAMVAYHSVLVFDVLGVSNFDQYQAPPEIPDDTPQPITDLFGIHRDLSKKNYLESYHDAVQAVDEAMSLFNLGSPDHRAPGAGRAAVLGAVQQAVEPGARARLRARGAAGHGSAAVGHLHLQPVDLPVDAR